MKKIVLVTGSSKGIGAATAILLAEQGFDICINYLEDEESANSVVESIKSLGVNAISVQADVSKESEVVNLFNSIDQELGCVTSVVNNVGILFQQMRLEEMDANRINKVFASNVTGTFLCCREAVRRMSTANGGQGGAIVNVSSVAARLGSPGEYIDYAASKGAIDTLTKGLSIEVAMEGIRVNGVRPGFIKTEIHAKGGEPDRLKRIKPNIPMQRGGEAEEVAAAIAWLLSDEASYVTGTNIDVAGGR